LKYDLQVDGPVLHYFDFTMLPYFELIAHIDDEGEYSGKEGNHLYDLMRPEVSFELLNFASAISIYHASFYVSQHKASAFAWRRTTRPTI
jgi:hypothetical protein